MIKDDAYCGILITEEWYNQCYDKNLVSVFERLYNQLTGESLSKLALEKLNNKLDKLGLDKDIRARKLYDRYYCYCKDNGKNNAPSAIIITGFFDATDFLQNYIKKDEEKTFIWAVLKLFIDCGGIVRIAGRDYFYGDDSEMLAIIRYDQFTMK